MNSSESYGTLSEKYEDLYVDYDKLEDKYQYLCDKYNELESKYEGLCEEYDNLLEALSIVGVDFDLLRNVMQNE